MLRISSDIFSRCGYLPTVKMRGAQYVAAVLCDEMGHNSNIG